MTWELSENYNWDGFVEDFLYQPIWLPWPEETEEVQELTSGIINWGNKDWEADNHSNTEPEIIYSRNGPVANRISILLSNGTTVQLWMLKFSWISQNTNWTFHRYKYYVESRILWNFKYIWRTNEEADEGIIKMIENKISELYPKDFPKENNEEAQITSIVWEVDWVSYTMSKIEQTNNIRVEFVHKWTNYVLTDIKWEIIRKQNHYFVYPEWATRKTQNSFRKRIWATWDSQEDKIRKMLRNINRVLNWNKDKDKEILEYLEDCKEVTPLEEALSKVKSDFWKQKPDTSITEITDILPQNLSIQIWQLDQWVWYPNRLIRVNWFRYEVWEEREIEWWVVVHIKPIFEDSESLELPDAIQYAGSADDTIRTLQSWATMKNSKTWSIKRIRVSDFHTLKSWVEKMFLDLNELAIWQTAESISKNSLLRRNYGFMTWYIRNYNKSLETSSQ